MQIVWNILTICKYIPLQTVSMSILFLGENKYRLTLALEPSPYEIFHLAPETDLEVEEAEGE